jgi:alkylation response protein AidB-like acyl-CoA dehydrogenase
MAIIDIEVGLSDEQRAARDTVSEEIGCWAVTEPDHDSDTLMVTEQHFHDPKLRANCSDNAL